MVQQIDLRTVPRDENGLILPAGRYVTLHDQNGHMTLRDLPFSETLSDRIYIFISKNPGCTAGQIAKAVDRKKSPWLLSKIAQLVSDGYLVRMESRWRNGVTCYLYEVL